jgi:hypothetical protein
MISLLFKIRNPKHEILNKSKIRNSNVLNNIFNFGYSIFAFVSDLDIRYSNFSHFYIG